MDISLAPGGAAEPQGQVVQGGGQLPSDRGGGQGREAGKPGQAPACWLPDMLVVAAEGPVDVEQEAARSLNYHNRTTSGCRQQPQGADLADNFPG